MNYDNIMHKLATTKLPVNNHLRRIMDKVRVAGLHKTAARMHAVPELDVKVATQLLGHDMMVTHLKFKKIASGLGAISGLAGGKLADPEDPNYITSALGGALSGELLGSYGEQLMHGVAPKYAPLAAALGHVAGGFTLPYAMNQPTDTSRRELEERRRWDAEEDEADGTAAAAGLNAMASGKQASINRMPTAMSPNTGRTSALLGLLKQMQHPQQPIAGRQLGGAVNRGTPGMFSGVENAANTFNPKVIPELPAMGRLPIAPASGAK